MNIVKKSKNSILNKFLAAATAGLLVVSQVAAVSQDSVCAPHKTITKKQALAVGGGVVGLAVVAAGVYGVAQYIASNGEAICDEAALNNFCDEICDKAKLCKPPTEVSADDWFRRLGGTDNFVNDYVRNYDALTEQINKRGGNDKKITENLEQIDKDIIRTLFNDDEDITSGTRHELLRRILKVSIFKNDLDKGCRGYIQGFNEVCTMVICKFLGESLECTVETEAKIYYVYNALTNNEFLNFNYDTMNAVMQESVASTCFKYYAFYKDYVNNDNYITALAPKLWTVFGTKAFQDPDHKRIIKIWDRIIADKAVYDSGESGYRLNHHKAFVKLFTVINLYVVKYWESVKTHKDFNYEMASNGATVGTHLNEFVKRLP